MPIDLYAGLWIYWFGLQVYGERAPVLLYVALRLPPEGYRHVAIGACARMPYPPWPEIPGQYEKPLCLSRNHSPIWAGEGSITPGPHERDLGGKNMTRPRRMGILAALPQEIQWAAKDMEVESQLRLPGGWVMVGKLWGKEVAVAVTGMGRQSKEAVDSLARAYPLHSLLSCGFGGGAAQGLRKGEAVICQSVLHPEKGELFSDDCLCLSAARALARAGIPFAWGRGLTVSHFVSNPQKKLALAKKYGVQVVEMESFWEAEAAVSWGIPFLAVRFISDALEERLPRLERLVGVRGDWQIKQAALYFASHPLEMLTLPGLLMGSWRARRSLQLFLKSYLEEFDEPR